MMWDVATLVVLAATSNPSGTPPAAPPPIVRSDEALRHYLQGRLLEERGDTGDALSQFYRAMLIDFRSASLARRVSELSARLGENERSLEFAERSLVLEPDAARGLWLKGAALFNLDRGDEALPYLERAVRTDSNQVEYVRTLARVAEQLDRVDLVARACSRAVALDDEDGESWFQLAAAEARLGEFETADRALDRAVDLNPLRPGSFFLQGLIHEGLGRSRQAIELYRRHLGVHGTDQLTRRRLVNLLAREKRYPEAYVEAKIVSRSAPTDEEVKETEIDLAFRSKHTGEALKMVDLMRKRAGDDPDRLSRVVGILARHDRSEAAFTLADRWQAGHPRDFRGPMLGARARAIATQTDSAVARARLAVALAPDSIGPKILLGRIYQDANRFRDAEGVWSETLGSFPGEVGVALELAFCREQLGDLKGALEVVRHALKREPDNAAVQNFLGYLLADHNQDLAEAERLIGRALAQEPANGAFVDSMGWLYYRLGRLAEARRQLERAVRLTGGDPVVHEHLGDVYKDMKLNDLAKEEYRKSLAGDRSNERVRAKLGEAR